MDCSKIEPFPAMWSVGVTFDLVKLWLGEAGTEEEATVCSNATSVGLVVRDIRGRESEWYACAADPTSPGYQPPFECSLANWRGEDWRVMVGPRAVVRRSSWGGYADYHAHVFMDSVTNVNRRQDLWARTLSAALFPQLVILESGFGSRLARSPEDAFLFLRLRFDPDEEAELSPIGRKERK